MMDYNALHPYPRYGAAVALYQARLTPDEITTSEALAPLVARAIDQALATYTVRTLDDPKAEGTTTLSFAWVKDPEPGTKTGQIASKGYYLAPHVITSDGAALSLLQAARALADEVRAGENLSKSTELTKAVSPLVAKVNSGKASPSNPKTSRLEAALTALATVTPDKAAAWSMGTAALIPDLPLTDADGRFPLLDYVSLFGRMRSRYYDTAAAMQTPLAKDGGYKRPRLHEGNFPEAPSNSALSTLGVVASVGWWARHGHTQGAEDPEGWARRVLDLLAERPLLVVTYGNDVIKNTRQERFGHHLVGLALDGDLRTVVHALRRVMPTAADNWQDPKVDLFRTMADRFLRLFTRPALHDFLATRAAYPAELGPVFVTYFTQHAMPPLSPDLVASARAYGAALNSAAYRAAKASAGDDEKRRGTSSRSLDEYKQRVLVEFESAVQSAKSGPELLAKVGSRAGRLGGFEMPPEAGPFMEAVASGAVGRDQARDLITAFMRLGTWTPKPDAAAGPPTPTPATAAPTALPAGPQDDLFPDDLS